MTDIHETIAATPPGKPGRVDAREWLRGVLASGPVPSLDVEAEALVNGISPRTLARARKALGVKAQKNGNGRFGWVLTMPTVKSTIKDTSGKNASKDASGVAEIEGHQEPKGHVEHVEPNVTASVAKKKPGGSNPGERRGGRAPGVPNKTTVLVSQAMNAAAADPAILPLDFLLGVYRDPRVDPRLRLDAAKAAAPFVHAKPITGPPGDAAESARVIDAITSEAERARLSRLRELDLKNLIGDDLSMSQGEKAELNLLHSWADTLPASLLGLTPEDVELREMLRDTPWGGPALQHIDPAEERERLKTKQAPVTEVKSMEPIDGEPLEKGETVWPADLQRDDDDLLE